MRGLAISVGIALAGCSLLGPAPVPDARAETSKALAAEVGWRPDVFILADGGGVAYASRVRDGSLEVIGFERSDSVWYNAMGGSWDSFGGTNTVAVSEGIRSGTILYGSAEPEVVRVVTDAPGAVGGRVVDGGWSVWSPDISLTERDDTVAWRFLAEDGSVVEEGTGWHWPLGGPFDPPPPLP